MLNHHDQHSLFILGSLEEIFATLEDNQVTLMTMLGSRFIKTIQEEVETWSKKLAILSETLDEWMVCQKTWMYLENIFGAEDVKSSSLLSPRNSSSWIAAGRPSWPALTRSPCA